jgi:type II secretory ATPase GspE/PulE/Tfp pilus assembly ATPase PilB-like protein
MGVFEIITINDELRKSVRESKSLSEIGTQFRRAKMLYAQEQALRKAISGTTAINEIIRVFSTSKKRKARRPEQNT